MFFGSCDCCDCTCYKGKLPYTYTVEFADLVNTTRTAYCNLTFSSNFGSGATGVVTAPGGCDDGEPCCSPSDRGPITGVLLTNGGSCYAKCGRAPPDLIFDVENAGGATFTPTFVETTYDGLPCWSIESIAISGSIGFVDGATISITPASGSIAIWGAEYKISFDGETATAYIDWTSAYSDGRYYKEDCSLPGIPAEVTVTPCGGGYGAVITPTIDTTPGSATFGQITNLTIDDGGEDYLAWAKICRGWDSLNGIPFVLRALTPKRLVTIGFESCYGTGACATVDNVGETTCGGNPTEWDGSPAPIRTVTLVDGGSGYAKLGRESPEWTVTQGGWTFTPAFTTAEKDACDLPRWSVSAIAVTSGSGASGLDGWVLAPAISNPEFAEENMQAVVHTRQPPTVSAYAKVFRKKPTWEITKNGWTFKPYFLLNGPIEYELSTWSVSAISITSGSGPSGLDGWALTHSVSSPEFAEEYMQAVVHTRQPPTVSAYANSEEGYGANFSITIEEVGGQPRLWRVTSILGGGGEGYPQNVEIAFSVPERTGPYGHYAESNATAIGTVNEQGTIISVELVSQGAYYLDNGVPQSVEVIDGGRYYRRDGSDKANFSVAVEEIGGQPKLWRVYSVTGGDQGGYSQSVEVLFSVPDRTGDYGHYTVNEARAIGTIDSSGKIASIEIVSPGAYYLDNGIPQSVEVKSGGLYYRENPSLEPHVADVTVAVNQVSGSSGSGAALVATVESDTSSSAFGEIVSLTVADGGSGYSYFGGPSDCQYFGGCRSGCGVGDPSVKITFQGHGKPAIVRLEDLSDALGPTSAAVWETDPVLDCDDLPTSATLMHGTPSGTVTMTPGGTWDSRGQDGCAGCPCIRDLVEDWPNQPISITSTCACKGGGTITGGGTIGNYSFNPCVVIWITGGDFEQEIDATVAAGLAVECVQHGCDETGDCQTCISVHFGAYVYYGENIIQFCQGNSGCTCGDLTIGEDGFIHGTVTVNTSCCTVTVVFG